MPSHPTARSTHSHSEFTQPQTPHPAAPVQPIAPLPAPHAQPAATYFPTTLISTSKTHTVQPAAPIKPNRTPNHATSSIPNQAPRKSDSPAQGGGPTSDDLRGKTHFSHPTSEDLQEKTHISHPTFEDLRGKPNLFTKGPPISSTAAIENAVPPLETRNPDPEQSARRQPFQPPQPPTSLFSHAPFPYPYDSHSFPEHSTRE